MGETPVEPTSGRSHRCSRPESLTGKQIKQLTANDFRGGQVLGDTQVADDTATVQSDGTGLASAQCPGRTEMTGGGYGAGNAQGIVRVSRPAGNGWIVYIEAAVPGMEFDAYAICAS